MGTRKDMISPLPVPKIPPDFSIANVSVTMAVGAPVAVCMYGERSCANGCLLVFVERDSGQVAAMLQLLRVASEQSSNGTLLTALLRANYTVHVYALDEDRVQPTHLKIEVSTQVGLDEGSFDVTSGSGDGMGNFYGGRGIDAGGKAANDDIEKCTDDVALMVILMILKQDSKDKDIVMVVMFGVMAIMMGLTMVAVGVEIMGVGVVMVIVIMMVIVMVMVVLVFRYHKESGSPAMQAEPEVSYYPYSVGCVIRSTCAYS
eukprot:Em0010g37a